MNKMIRQAIAFSMAVFHSFRKSIFPAKDKRRVFPFLFPVYSAFVTGKKADSIVRKMGKSEKISFQKDERKNGEKNKEKRKSFQKKDREKRKSERKKIQNIYSFFRQGDLKKNMKKKGKENRLPHRESDTFFPGSPGRKKYSFFAKNARFHVDFFSGRKKMDLQDINRKENGTKRKKNDEKKVFPQEYIVAEKNIVYRKNKKKKEKYFLPSFLQFSTQKSPGTSSGIFPGTSPSLAICTSSGTFPGTFLQSSFSFPEKSFFKNNAFSASSFPYILKNGAGNLSFALTGKKKSEECSMWENGIRKKEKPFSAKDKDVYKKIPLKNIYSLVKKIFFPAFENSLEAELPAGEIRSYMPAEFFSMPENDLHISVTAMPEVYDTLFNKNPVSVKNKKLENSLLENSIFSIVSPYGGTEETENDSPARSAGNDGRKNNMGKVFSGKNKMFLPEMRFTDTGKNLLINGKWKQEKWKKSKEKTGENKEFSIADGYGKTFLRREKEKNLLQKHLWKNVEAYKEKKKNIIREKKKEFSSIRKNPPPFMLPKENISGKGKNFPFYKSTAERMKKNQNNFLPENPLFAKSIRGILFRELKKKILLPENGNKRMVKKVLSGGANLSPETKMFFLFREMEILQKEKGSSRSVSDEWINSLIKQYMEENIPSESV